MTPFRTLIASAAALTLATGFIPAQAQTAKAPVKNIVLVHGAFLDGSGWQGVYKILKKDGYKVTIVQNPTTSLADDVAATKRVLAESDGPAILVGHSYGGMVISQAGVDPKVAGLVFVAAFVPEKGESVASLNANPPAGAPVPPIVPSADGYLLLDRAKFAQAFAADVDPAEAAFMADSQQPWKASTVGEAVTETAWKTKPSWYLVAAQDRMIPPSAQRAMAARGKLHTVEADGSHAIFASKPDVVAKVIEDAARAASK
jgi:pimeloyl-ACP methyl ester carboxylesterase